MHSIILTVHNKDWLLEKVLEGIYYNTRTPYELIIVLDGCSDNSERVVWDTLLSTPVEWKLLHAPDVYETKANNLGLKAASGDKVIIIQDDIIVNEKDWNVRMEKPFKLGKSRQVYTLKRARFSCVVRSFGRIRILRNR